MGKRKHKELTLKTKYEALRDLEDGMSNKDASIKYSVPSSTLSTWKNNKEKIFLAFKNSSLKRQRVKTDKYEKLNESLLTWFTSMRGNNIPINGPILIEKAREFATAFNYEDFSASNGWLRGWKERYGITFKEVSGESAKVTSEMTAPWEETTLPTILARYELKDIFNADEFGLFYQALPLKSYHFKGKRCSGGKHSKVRLTGMTASNALGERLPMFVIGKSAKPRCFKT
ncbi:tigger transposable element-derived protein 4-like [Hydractinia symbiolongicarpus]|uniref:tigger transposable element-derived protein 4-like n=1 Tax=Hydractinia symbiolongicarpus TaxID=13093 RepID=UPI00254C961B|nr:tigger transposable element-derived protein 4-like [Hydractinia symbiolongicarpus]